jgi:ATP-binding cassette subfamily B (MDR/TAP) protein 1
MTLIVISTLIKDGSIMIDGVDVRELNIGWLRQQIGIVSQEPILFNCSIKSNILYGLPSDAPVPTEDMITSTAKRANAHDFISKIPSGYDGVVGERGAMLSGGQKQSN